jgi:hypothetical protein
MFFLAILAVSFWLAGYFLTARRMSNTGLLSENLEKIIAPPRWLNYLCGASGNKEYPRGTMRVFAFRTQIFGISLLIFLLCSSVWRFSVWAYFIGLPLAYLVSYILTTYISKKYLVREQIKEPVKKIKRDPMTPTKITDDLSYSIVGDSLNLYSEFGGKGGANLTIELEEIDALIDVLQSIKTALQNEQSKATDGKN